MVRLNRWGFRANHPRYHESLGNLTPADTILLERERIKRQTIANRRLQQQLHAA